MLNYFRDKNEGTCLRSGEGRKEPASLVTPGEVGVRLGREKEKQKSEKTEDGTSMKKKGITPLGCGLSTEASRRKVYKITQRTVYTYRSDRPRKAATAFYVRNSPKTNLGVDSLLLHVHNHFIAHRFQLHSLRRVLLCQGQAKHKHSYRCKCNAKVSRVRSLFAYLEALLVQSANAELLIHR